MSKAGPLPPAYKPAPGEVLVAVTSQRPSMLRQLHEWKARLQALNKERSVSEDEEAATLYSQVARLEDQLRQMTKAEAKARTELRNQPLPVEVAAVPPVTSASRSSQDPVEEDKEQEEVAEPDSDSSSSVLSAPIFWRSSWEWTQRQAEHLMARREKDYPQEHQVPRVTTASKRNRPVSPPGPKEKTKKLAASSSATRTPQRPGLVTRASRSSHPAPSSSSGGAYVS